MKRSEVLKIISDHMYDNMPKAELLLQELELIGMLPPSRKIDYNELTALRKYDSSDLFKYYHSWDQEDPKPEYKYDPDEIPF